MTVDPSAVTAALPNAAPEVRANETVGKYRLDRPLGSGGMGIVWAAFDPDLERAVALKLLRSEATEQTSMRTRLLREARAMARLRHPNVVTVFDVGTDKGRDYIAMELVVGGTLDEWLQTKPARGAIVDALVAAGRGLAAAHAAGLVHRDFKPHNVLRAGDGHIYVTDFGLARGQIEEGAELVPVALPVDEPVSGSQPRRKRDLVLDSPLTQTGVLIGTPAYMAPEQFAGATPDPKSDQFAFCVTAWQALTGERPFRGESLTQIEAAARQGAGKLTAEMPPALRAVLVRGLDPDPAARWPDMAALLDAIAAASAPPQKRRKWLLPLLAATVLVGGVVVVGIAAWQKNRSVEPDCIDPEEAFARVWGERGQTAFTGEQGIAIIAVVDQTRKSWVKSYGNACSGERTREKQKRIDCLLAARERIAQRIADARTKKEFDWQLLGTLPTSLMDCDPNAMRDGFRFNFDKSNKGDDDVDVDPPDPPEIPDVDVDIDTARERQRELEQQRERAMRDAERARRDAERARDAAERARRENLPGPTPPAPPAPPAPKDSWGK